MQSPNLEQFNPVKVSQHKICFNWIYFGTNKVEAFRFGRNKIERMYSVLIIDTCKGMSWNGDSKMQDVCLILIAQEKLHFFGDAIHKIPLKVSMIKTGIESGLEPAEAPRMPHCEKQRLF